MIRVILYTIEWIYVLFIAVTYIFRFMIKVGMIK